MFEFCRGLALVVCLGLWNRIAVGEHTLFGFLNAKQIRLFSFPQGDNFSLQRLFFLRQLFSLGPRETASLVLLNAQTLFGLGNAVQLFSLCFSERSKLSFQGLFSLLQFFCSHQSLLVSRFALRL